MVMGMIRLFHSGELKLGREQEVLMKKISVKRYVSFLLILLILTVGIIAPVSAQAVPFKKAKPRIASNSAYLNNKVYIKWSAVKGAKKYEVQRAKINPSTGKIGKWVKWKTVKKPYVRMVAAGGFKYRIRALKGKKKSKWSAAKRIFAANAKITHMGYTEPEVLFGVTLSEGVLEFRVLVSNRTHSSMGFVRSGTRLGVQNTVIAIHKKTRKPVKTWDAYLDTGSSGGIAKQVNARKNQSVYFYAYVSEEEWAKYKNCKFMITSSFYPNPTVEPISTQMAIAYTANVAESAIAGK